MKLDALCSSPKQIVLEDKPGPQEKIAIAAAMAARQGKDPGPLVKALRAQIDPAYGARQQGRTKFNEWIKGAPEGQTVTGKAFGRKIKVTTLDKPAGAAPSAPPDTGEHAVGQSFTDSIGRESVVTIAEAKIRKLVNEDFFGIGKLIIGKLRQLIGDVDPESPKTKAALDQYPNLAAVMRYARTASIDLEKDNKFWELIDKVTNNKSAEVRKAVDAIYEIDESEIHEKTIIQEAKVSDVIGSLGLSKDQVTKILKDHNLQDIEYDLGDIRQSMTGKGGPGPKKPAAKTADVPKPTEEKDKTLVMRDNLRYASVVIKAAAAIMKAEEEAKANATTPQQKQAAPQQVAQAVQQAAGNLKDPAIVDAAQLGVGAGI